MSSRRNVALVSAIIFVIICFYINTDLNTATNQIILQSLSFLSSQLYDETHRLAIAIAMYNEHFLLLLSVAGYTGCPNNMAQKCQIIFITTSFQAKISTVIS